MLYLIYLGIVAIGLAFVFYYRLKNLNNEIIFYCGFLLAVIALALLPFVDPLMLAGYFAEALFMIPRVSTFAMIAGFISINIGIYGIHMLATSYNLLKEARKRGIFLSQNQFLKRRFPIFASFHLLGICYFVLMGSPVGIITMNIIAFFLYLECRRVEKKILIPNFGERYLKYKQQVRRRMYSDDMLILFIILHGVFGVGVMGLMFFSYL